MADTVVESLILDLLQWLATADRSYEEVGSSYVTTRAMKESCRCED
jgi:hypothetical protein